MFWTRSLLVSALCVAPLATSLGCGGEFTAAPPPLIDSATTLDELVEGSFDYETARLFPPGQLSRNWDESTRWSNGGIPTTAAYEQVELGDSYAQVQAMRLAVDDDTAWQAGEGLDLGVRHYTAGARAFNAAHYAQARPHFEKVLELPEAEASPRRLWARFMLARLELVQWQAALRAAASDTPETNASAAPADSVSPAIDTPQATAIATAFAQVRQAVEADPQHRDPLGLVRASYGEEAAVALRLRDFARAATLYGEQAALGSWSGKASLRLLARRLLNNEADLRVAMADPLLQRLVTAYLYTGGCGDCADGYFYSEMLHRYFSAIAAQPDANVAGADQFAAAAYRIGSYELAAQLIQHSDSPLALWVKAKLALRAGNNAAAEAAFVAAAAGFRARKDFRFAFSEGADSDTANRVDLERAALCVREGRKADAMALLLRNDGPYLTELAVLATHFPLDELRGIADDEARQASGANQDQVPPKLDDLRETVGRLLLRDHQYADVDRYFSGELQASVRRYASGMTAAAQSQGVARAQGLFQAAAELVASGFSMLQTGLIGIDESERPYYYYRRQAADLANQAADELPRRSQAFAAVLCHATGWLLAREPENARVYYKRYQRQGAFMAWADNFGRDCPAPDFSAAAAPPSAALNTSDVSAPSLAVVGATARR